MPPSPSGSTERKEGLWASAGPLGRQGSAEPVPVPPRRARGQQPGRTADHPRLCPGRRLPPAPTGRFALLRAGGPTPGAPRSPGGPRPGRPSRPAASRPPGLSSPRRLTPAPPRPRQGPRPPPERGSGPSRGAAPRGEPPRPPPPPRAPHAERPRAPSPGPRATCVFPPGGSPPPAPLTRGLAGVDPVRVRQAGDGEDVGGQEQAS